ncbi:amidohydrolase [Microbulbifer pacificus]|uniref:Amidohydrolase n=1 Tax=Microbulbifer pacificus TaxID=407164 RepID=A0AAU0N5A3_9GAMM|nr:amidohydrolase [Microbulbifer pacificus]WOX07216.1 amidohydrolase [Microbulbifer pacificus]
MPHIRKLLILFSWLLTSACSQQAPDRILYNGAGIPAAVAIKDGKVLAMGRDGEILPMAGAATAKEDLAGATLLPGFVDHHIHLLNVGRSLVNRQNGEALFVDLSGITSKAALVERLRARSSQLAQGQWLLGKGWSQGAWGATELPDRKWLDEAVPDRPVFLTRVDGHAGWANSAALTLAGIDRASMDPAGGRILRRPDGEPTGVLLERANEVVLALLPKPDVAELTSAFAAAARTLARAGNTEVYDAGFLAPPGIVGLNLDSGYILDALLALDRTHPLPLKINLMIPAPSALAEQLVSGAPRPGSPRVTVTHIKLFADGALGSRGAALTHPFNDDPSTRGLMRMSDDEIVQWTQRALDSGLGLAAHAIGDDAVHRVLNAFEFVLQSHPDISPERLRLEHASYLSDEDSARAAGLGISLSVQPNFVYPDDQGHAMEDARLGDTDRVYAFASLLKAGNRLLGGSDAFTLPTGPLSDMYSAVTRQNYQGFPRAGWHPEQKLPLEQALSMFSRPWQLGMPADFTLLDKQPGTLDAAQLRQARVLATYLDGQRVSVDN